MPHYSKIIREYRNAMKIRPFFPKRSISTNRRDFWFELDNDNDIINGKNLEK